MKRFVRVLTVAVATAAMSLPASLSAEPASAPLAPCEDAPCPTSNPNVDCWSGGKWYYNHCESSCVLE